MRNTAIVLLTVFVVTAFGLTACGRQCTDVCRYAVLCSENIPNLWADCNNFCRYDSESPSCAHFLWTNCNNSCTNQSDCATACDVESTTCQAFHACVANACSGFFFPPPG